MIPGNIIFYELKQVSQHTVRAKNIYYMGCEYKLISGAPLKGNQILTPDVVIS